MITHFKDGTFVYPAALFRRTPEEQEAAERAPVRNGSGWVDPVTGEDSERGEDDGTEPEDGDEGDMGSDHDDQVDSEAA
jgi:hypothetical protein